MDWSNLDYSYEQLAKAKRLLVLAAAASIKDEGGFSTIEGRCKRVLIRQFVRTGECKTFHRRGKATPSDAVYLNVPPCWLLWVAGKARRHQWVLHGVHSSKPMVCFSRIQSSVLGIEEHIARLEEKQNDE